MFGRANEMRGLAVLLGALAVFFLPTVMAAQGVLVVVDPDQHIRLPRPIYYPRPPQPQPQPTSQYEISSLDVSATIKDQVARVEVAQEFHNTGSTVLEVSFMFPLPYDGAIDRLTLMVDGNELPAKLLDADEARRRYEAIVRKNRDPALLEWVGHGMFQTSVFPVPAGGKRKVTLRYTQLCRADNGVTDFLFPLSTAKYTAGPVGSIDFRVAIQGRADVKNVYSPSHDVKIERDGPRNVVVTWHAENTVPTRDFRLFHDVGDESLATRLLSYRPQGGDEDSDNDGYFLLLANPPIKAHDDAEALPKTVMFVVDRSGSMSGKKIEQARDALKFVLDNLNDGDLFNIVAYDTEVSLFQPELQKYDSETRAEAVGFVNGIASGGSTNIDGALAQAMGQLNDSSRPTYLIFLTDGLPTAGEKNEAKIVANATAANHVAARIFSFGVGYDVNSRLLDRLTNANRGQSEYVGPDENIEDRVSRLYNRISSPVLTDVSVEFKMDGLRPEDGSLTGRVYPKHDFDLFAGEQLVLVGRYHKSGDVKITVTGKDRNEIKTFYYEAKLAEPSSDETYAFIERLWAARRIGEIIDEIDLNGENQELVDELVRLSTRHGILTPYTSFLADETTNLHEVAANRVSAGERLAELKQTSGNFAFEQRAGKQMLKRSVQAYDSNGGYGAGGYGAGGGGFGRGGLVAGRVPARASVNRDPFEFNRFKSVQDGTIEGKDAGPAVQNVGNRTFYRRGERWVDSSVTEEQEKHLVHVKQFSDEYFKLIDKHGEKITPYLVFDEAVLVQVDGVAYLIEPEKEG